MVGEVPPRYNITQVENQFRIADMTNIFHPASRRTVNRRLGLNLRRNTFTQLNNEEFDIHVRGYHRRFPNDGWRTMLSLLRSLFFIISRIDGIVFAFFCKNGKLIFFVTLYIQRSKVMTFYLLSIIHTNCSRTVLRSKLGTSAILGFLAFFPISLNVQLCL